MGGTTNKTKKADVQEMDSKVNSILEQEKSSETDKNDDSIHIHDGSYKVTTTCDILNIRAGAGLDYKIIGQIRETVADKNIYTIEEIKNGWGRLSIGGWIALAYTKR